MKKYILLLVVLLSLPVLACGRQPSYTYEYNQNVNIENNDNARTTINIGQGENVNQRGGTDDVVDAFAAVATGAIFIIVFLSLGGMVFGGGGHDKW